MRESQDQERQLGRIFKLDRDRGYALASPLIARSGKPVFVHVGDVAASTWLGLEVGGWVHMVIVDDGRGPRGREVVLAHPDPIELQRRLLQRYSESPGMVGGANPGSHRLDGLTMSEAKKWRESGGMTADQYYGCMSENGLRGCVRRCGFDAGSRTREELVIAMLDLIGNESNESESE